MQKQDNAQVLTRLTALKAMTVGELKAEWQTLMGSAAPNNSRSFLEQRLAYRIQELTSAGCRSPRSACSMHWQMRSRARRSGNR